MEMYISKMGFKYKRKIAFSMIGFFASANRVAGQNFLRGLVDFPCGGRLCHRAN